MAIVRGIKNINNGRELVGVGVKACKRLDTTPKYSESYVSNKTSLMACNVCAARYLFGEGNHTVDCTGDCDANYRRVYEGMMSVPEYKSGMDLDTRGEEVL